MTEQQPDPVDLGHLAYTDEPAPDLPPAGPDDIEVPRTFRLPVELNSSITTTATAGSRQSSLADVLSALVSIRSRDAA
jgi:hypothetical protein